jgi:tRNA(adenine34) deaminase
MESAVSVDEKFMSLAIAEAEKGKMLGNLPFGAVIVMDNEVISCAYAEDISAHDVTAHAEVQAIKKACDKLKTINLKDSTIYTTNEPCVMCAGAILQSGISKAVIGAVRGDIPGRFQPKKFGIDNLIENYNYKPEIIKGVLKNKVIELFKKIA